LNDVSNASHRDRAGRRKPSWVPRRKPRDDVRAGRGRELSTQETVLITGAGSGIGREFTKLFLADGSRVLAVGLLQSGLDTLAAELDPKREHLSTLALDLSADGAAASVFG
jgi:FlaA1/EpsC-like NDP-sugar epimerase